MRFPTEVEIPLSAVCTRYSYLFHHLSAKNQKNADLTPEERINAYNKNMATGGWISKDLPALAELINSRWLIANFEAGDMVIHSPYLIHAATVNFDAQNHMRLSTDIRYQRKSDRIDQRWANDYYVGDNL